MTLFYATAVLVLKATFVFFLTLCVLPSLRNAGAAVRHLLCAVAMGAALLLPLTLLPHSSGITIPASVILRATAIAPTAKHAPSRFNGLAWVAFVWALGSVVCLLRLAAGYWSVSRTVANARAASRPGGVPVLVADVSVPMLAGLLRPIVLLPAESLEWPARQRDAALQHELMHFRRKDLWTNLLANLVCAIYWFHPLAWMVSSRLRTEQEAACDDAVISAGFDPPVYAEALLSAARLVTSNPFLGCPMLTRKNQTSLHHRIARLLDDTVTRTASRFALLRASAVFSTAALAIGFLNFGVQPSAKGFDQAKEAPKPQVYRVGDGVTPPRVLSKVEPGYTEEARDAKIAGSVVLSVIIDPNGLAREITILKSLDSGLDAKAVEAVQQWLFQPGELNGEKVAVRATIEINFRLI